jgi:Uma2 family endonuclease
MLTMSTAPKRVPTFEALYAEIERLPQGITGQILIPGVLTTMSRPGASHSRTLAHCSRALDRFDQELGGHGWWIRQEFEVRFPGDRLAVPDLAGWRHPELPDDNPLRVLPAWCAEILSPSTASDDRTLKLPL